MKKLKEAEKLIRKYTKSKEVLTELHRQYNLIPYDKKEDFLTKFITLFSNICKTMK